MRSEQEATQTCVHVSEENLLSSFRNVLSIEIAGTVATGCWELKEKRAGKGG